MQYICKYIYRQHSGKPNVNKIKRLYVRFSSIIFDERIHITDTKRYLVWFVFLKIGYHFGYNHTNFHEKLTVLYFAVSQKIYRNLVQRIYIHVLYLVI